MHHVRVLVTGGSGPFEDSDASCAMENCLLHAQVVESGLLACDDQVDVVTALQAVVGNREERVRVGGKVYANHRRASC